MDAHINQKIDRILQRIHSTGSVPSGMPPLATPITVTYDGQTIVERSRGSLALDDVITAYAAHMARLGEDDAYHYFEGFSRGPGDTFQINFGS